MRPGLTDKLLCKTALAAAVLWAGLTGPAHAATNPADAQDMARQMYMVLSGEIAAQTGHPGVAYNQILSAARELDSAELYQRAVEIALSSGATTDAMNAVDAWRQAQPSSVQAQDWAAQLLLALGRGPEAVAAIDRLIDITPAPKRGPTVLALSGLFARESDPAAALDLGTRTLAPYMSMPEARVVVGALRASAGNPRGGFDDALAALQAEPSLRAGAVLLLRVYSVDPQRADAALHAADAAGALDIDLKLAWIQDAASQDRLEVALEQARAVTAAHPDDPDGWLMLGALEQQAGDHAAARSALLQLVGGPVAATLPPQVRARALVALAEATSSLGDHAGALRWLEQVPAGQEARAVLLERASISAAQGEVKAALAMLDTLPDATAQQRRDRLMARAELLRGVHDNAAAYRVLESGLKDNAADPDYVYETAMLAGKVARRDEMLSLLRGLTSSAPGYQQAWNALGYTLADEGGDLTQARRLVEQALKLAPGNPFVLDSMGWVEFRSGDLDRARQLIGEAWAARRDGEIGAHLAEVELRAGDRAAAAATMREALAAAPDDSQVHAAARRLGLKP